jgi:hypothetical protein
MNYNTVYKAYGRAFRATGIRSSKVTHINRVTAVQDIDAQNVGDNQQRRIGRWKGDVMKECYLNTFPKQAMRALAGFYPDSPGSYYIPRASITPPEDLQRLVFPEVDRWLAAFEDRTVQEDMAGANFLELMKFLRVVLLQVFFFVLGNLFYYE